MVTLERTGEGLESICVELARPDAESWEPVATTTTDASGHYTVPNVTGDYRVLFSCVEDDYKAFGQFFDTAAKQEDAEVVTVDEHETRTLDVSLDTVQRISESPGVSEEVMTSETPMGLELVGPDGNFWGASDGSINEITEEGDITTYSEGLNPDSVPTDFVVGPDDDIWFADLGSSTFEEPDNPAIGRITQSGDITLYDSAVDEDGKPTELYVPADLTTGSDGNLWASITSTWGIGVHGPPGIARIEPDGTITKFALDESRDPKSIVNGPDGNLWFADEEAIGKVTPQGEITFFEVGSPLSGHILLGPDSNLWFTGHGLIGRISPSGTISTFTNGLIAESRPRELVVGSDDNLWFTDPGLNVGGPPPSIGRITTAGEIVKFQIDDSGIPGWPKFLTLAGDGDLWFVSATPNRLGRISPSGNFTEYSLGLPRTTIGQLVPNSDDTALWFSGRDDVGGSTTRSIHRVPVWPISPGHTLQVLFEGEGEGRVSSSPLGLSCDGPLCFASVAGPETVSLSASSLGGSKFAGWSGSGCSGTGDCQVDINSDAVVTATFEEGDPPSEEPPPDNDEKEPRESSGSDTESGPDQAAYDSCVEPTQEALSGTPEAADGARVRARRAHQVAQKTRVSAVRALRNAKRSIQQFRKAKRAGKPRQTRQALNQARRARQQVQRAVRQTRRAMRRNAQIRNRARALVQEFREAEKAAEAAKRRCAAEHL